MHDRSVLCQAELAHAREQLDRQGGDLIEWRSAVAAKDLEIQNLQVMSPPAPSKGTCETA